jgi:LPS export ABC transporter protein LptC
LLTLGLALIIGWSIYSSGGKMPEQLRADENTSAKDMVINGVYLIEKRDNNKTLEIKARKANMAADDTRTDLISFSMISLENKKNPVTVFADNGFINNSANEITANGNVLVRDTLGRTLVTDHLIWKGEKDEISTDGVVRLFGDRFIIHGTGLIVNPSQGRMKILNNVSAIFN